MKKLIISAGGNGARIKSLLVKRFNNIPKHMLPLPQKNTILKEIVTKALAFFDKIIISVNNENKKYFETFKDYGEQVEVVVDVLCTGPLGPMIRELLHTKETVYGCAGDFYCEFDWKEFYSFHRENCAPISILISKSLSVPEGAKFLLNQNIIAGWERVSSYTSSSDLINMGAYILTPNQEVLTEIQSLTKHKEDGLFDKFIPKGVVSAFNPGGMGFNVNIPRVYYELCRYLKKNR